MISSAKATQGSKDTQKTLETRVRDLSGNTQLDLIEIKMSLIRFCGQIVTLVQNNM